MFKGLHHVVIAVKDIEQGMSQLEAVYGAGFGPVREGGNGFKSAVLPFDGAAYLELVSPTDDTGPVGRRVASAGEGVYMIAMDVDDIEATLVDLRAKGIRLIGDPGPGNPVRGQVFIHPQSAGGVLTLLVQR